MTVGLIYWAIWRIVLPKIFGYELVQKKVVLDDGTVVNVVRLSFIVFSQCAAPSPNLVSEICLFYSFHERKVNESRLQMTFKFDIVWVLFMNVSGRREVFGRSAVCNVTRLSTVDAYCSGINFRIDRDPSGNKMY